MRTRKIGSIKMTKNNYPILSFSGQFFFIFPVYQKKKEIHEKVLSASRLYVRKKFKCGILILLSQVYVSISIQIPSDCPDRVFLSSQLRVVVNNLTYSKKKERGDIFSAVTLHFMKRGWNTVSNNGKRGIIVKTQKCQKWICRTG